SNGYAPAHGRGGQIQDEGVPGPALPVPSAFPPAINAPAINAPALGNGVMQDAYGLAVPAPSPASPQPNAQAQQLLELKAQIENDASPRYVVHKRGMDHGPFTAIELVRHIDAHSFTDEDVLVDSFEGRQAPVREYPQVGQL